MRHATKRRPTHRRRVIEPVERRLLMAAHVAGSATSYATIQAAVNAAAAGGTVTVDAGTYAEQVTVNKPLTIQGAKAGVDARGGGRPTASAASESVVTGTSGTNGRSAAFRILADDVTIDGFTVTGQSNPDELVGAGVVIGPKQSGTHVVNDVVRGNVAGLFLANYSPTDAALIQHCYFGSNNNDGPNGGRGVYTNGTVSGGNLTNVTIDANTFANNLGGDGTTGLEAALAFEAGTPGRQSAIRITNNAFTNNGKAVLFFNATGVLIQGNTVTGSQDQWSGALRFEGHNDNVSILYNTVTDNPGPGVAVDSKGMEGDNSAFAVNYNNFGGNNYAYAVPISVANNFETYNGTFDARFNYWGAASGPSGYGTGTGDAVGGGYMQIGTGQGWALKAGGNITFAPFATARITATGPTPATAPAAPTNLTATAASAAQVNLSWTDTSAGTATGFVVQRAADGVTFAPVGTAPAGSTTYADTAGLTAGVTYSYRVLATNTAGTSAPSNVATATPAAADGTTNVSDLAWTAATTGYGTVTRNATVKGKTITLRGTPYATGLGVHAVSTVSYAINGAYATFTADVGVDDETGGQGSVVFQVIGDGVTLYDSGVLTGTSPAAHPAVNVAGVTTLTLVATNGIAGSIDFDHADWAGARLWTTPVLVKPTPTAIPAAPVAVTATAPLPTSVTLAWTAGGPTQTGFAVDRSTDNGATWATIATTVLPAYIDARATAGTRYAYRVRATNAAGTSAPSATVSVTTPAVATAAAPVSLTTLTPTSATVGWGTLQTNHSIKGTPIKLRGITYAAGLGVHASSTLAYAVAGRYATFAVDVGIDDETNGQGAVRFQVLGDGRTLYDSGVLKGTSPVAHVSVAVAGVTTLTLVAAPGVTGSIDFDHADWASPTLTPATAIAAAPAAQVAVTARAGTVLGSAGAAAAFDGNLSSFFTGPTGTWVGLDLGSAKSVSRISFAPRAGYAARMVGGMFQASTSADFTTGVTTLYTITTAPAVGSLTTATLTTAVTARYVRYVGPANSTGDVAEVAFYG